MGSFFVCFGACMYHFIRIVIAGAPDEYAKIKGKPGPAIKYSLTKAMSPAKKETAYLHLPTYLAGMLYHVGTFLSFAMLIIVFFNVSLIIWLEYIAIIILGFSFISGVSIFVKRIITKKVRHLSNPDDYISNLLVTLMHAFTIIVLLDISLLKEYYIFWTVLFLYIPLGKLRHLVYFFTSRIHLGIFYGRRGVWPAKKEEV